MISLNLDLDFEILCAWNQVLLRFYTVHFASRENKNNSQTEDENLETDMWVAVYLSKPSLYKTQ